MKYYTIALTTLLFCLILVPEGLQAQPVSFDGDKPVVNYDTMYSQEFNPTEGWDRFKFYDQWNALLPNIFSAAEITDGFLKYKWIEKRVICSRMKYEQPYIFEADYEYATSSNRAGMVIRIQGLNESIQEPVSDPGFNREGIAFYPSPEGDSMIVQFSEEDKGSGSDMAFTRIKVRKPEGAGSLFERGVMRIEDFGSSIYVYRDDAPFIRIELGGESGSLYTSGSVYDANVQEMGSFSGMEIETRGLVAFATRDAAPGLYGASIKYNDETDLEDPPIYPSAYRDLHTDTWVATDDLGRVMPDNAAVGPPRDDLRRVVGIFYITWHTEGHYSGFPSPFSADVTKILAEDPSARLDANHPLWNRPSHSYHWGEPEMGYFLSQDEFVIRKDMAMLSNAGVDVLCMDVTNAVRYWDEWEVLFTTMQKMKAEGNKVPQFCFWAFNGPVISVVQDLYDWFYKRERYKDLWFYWDGKPLLLYNANPDLSYNNPNPYYDPDAVSNPDNPNYGDPYYTQEFYTDYTQEVKDYFTSRNMWWGYYDWPVGSGNRYVGTEDNWSFGYDLQNENVKGMDPDDLIATHNGINEQAAVCPAQHPSSLVGKSWRRETGEPPLDEYDMPAAAYVPWLDKTVDDPEGYGIYYQDRWEEALESDPEFLYMNDWNEWSAGKFHPETGTFNFMRRNSPFYFVDQYNAEFNRAMQPMKDGYSDNYYMQMAQNIRRYKGVRPNPVQGGMNQIQVDSDFSDWSSVTNEFFDAIGDTRHRDHHGYGGLHYTNETGRNDIMDTKVAYDADSLYFYVKTVYETSPPADTNWMLLFIDVDRNKGTGWEGYDFLINHGDITSTHTGLKQWTGADWGKEISVPFALSGTEMELSLPRAALMLEEDMPEFYFKWADNPQHLDDISCFFNDGEAAPDRRFNYNFSTSAVSLKEQSPYANLGIPGTIELEDFDKGSAGIAYSDATFGNSGRAYRTDVSVDIREIATDAYGITEIYSNEWLEYTVDIASIGIFTVSLTYASDSADQGISLFLDDRPLYSRLELPSTGSPDNWVSIDFELSLNAGNHILKVLADSATGGLHLDNIVFTEKETVYPGNGTGLYMSLYNGKPGGRGWFTDSLCTETDPAVDHQWPANASPGCDANDTYWNARWQGYIEALFSEEYTFTVTVNDWVRVWLDGQLVIDAFKGSGVDQTHSVKIDPIAGDRIPVIIEYANLTGNGEISLEWESATQQKEVIPQKQLYPEILTAVRPFWSRAGRIQIYPVPANELVYLESPGPGSFEIYTLEGRKCYAKDNVSGILELDVSGWESGMYIVTFKDSYGIDKQKLLVY